MRKSVGGILVCNRWDMKFFKRIDVLIIGGMLLVGLAAFLVWSQVKTKPSLQHVQAIARIYYGNEPVKTLELAPGKAQSFTVPQNEHVIFHVNETGEIRFESSNCPDQICVHTGYIGKPGELAACLPNGLILQIESADSAQEDLDVVA